MVRTYMARRAKRSLSPTPPEPPSILAPPTSPTLRPPSPPSHATSLISPPISLSSQIPAPPSPPPLPSPPPPPSPPRHSPPATPYTSAVPTLPAPTAPAPSDPPAKSSLSLLADPFPDWRGRFQVLERLGYGSFASVWLAEDSQYPAPHPHHVVALKRIRPLSSAQRIYDEARFLEQLGGRHHCCELLEVLVDPEDARCHPTLVLSYMPHESYKAYLPHLSLAHVQQYMRALLESLAHLAAQPAPILHRDLKPANFLVQWPPSAEVTERWLRDKTDVSGGYKLVDFGLAHAQHKHADRERSRAREQQHKRRRHNSEPVPQAAQLAAGGGAVVASALAAPALKKSSTLGTRGFRAPEILLRHPRQQLCCASDVWNAGVIFLSLLTQRYPIFDRSDSEEALVQLMALLGTQTHVGDTNISLHNIDLQRAAEDADMFAAPTGAGAAAAADGKDTQFPSLEEYCWLSTERHWPSEAFDLLRGLLAFDPNDRCTAQQALNHPFLALDYDVQDATYAKRVTAAEANELAWTQRKQLREKRWRDNERQRRLALEKENHSLAQAAAQRRQHSALPWSAVQSPLHQLYSRGSWRADASSRGAQAGSPSGSGWNSRAELSLPPSQPHRRVQYPVPSVPMIRPHDRAIVTRVHRNSLPPSAPALSGEPKQPISVNQQVDGPSSEADSSGAHKPSTVDNGEAASGSGTAEQRERLFDFTQPFSPIRWRAEHSTHMGPEKAPTPDKTKGDQAETSAEPLSLSTHVSQPFSPIRRRTARGQLIRSF